MLIAKSVRIRSYYRGEKLWSGSGRGALWSGISLGNEFFESSGQKLQVG